MQIRLTAYIDIAFCVPDILEAENITRVSLLMQVERKTGQNAGYGLVQILVQAY